jgi:hypothetical protein
MDDAREGLFLKANENTGRIQDRSKLLAWLARFSTHTRSELLRHWLQRVKPLRELAYCNVRLPTMSENDRTEA